MTSKLPRSIFCLAMCAGWNQYKDKAGKPTGDGWCGFDFCGDPCSWPETEVQRYLQAEQESREKKQKPKQ